MKFTNRALSVLMASCVAVFSVCAPAYAAATSSDADYTTDSDFESTDYDLADNGSDEDIVEDTVITFDDDFLDFVYSDIATVSNASSISLLASSYETPVVPTNTVDDLTKVRINTFYYDESNDLYSVGTYPSSSGIFAFGSSANRDSGARIQFRIPYSCFPSRSGNYLLQLGVASDISGYTIDSCRYVFGLTSTNTSETYSSGSLSYGFNPNTGSYSTSLVIDTTAASFDYLYIQFFSSDVDANGGQLSIAFTASDAATTVTAPSYTSTDISTSTATSSAETASNTASIASSTADMADTLKEIVQTISNQLEALWDQMYNYMHLEQLANDNTNTQKIIDTLNNGLSVEIENQDSNFDELMANDDANTDAIIQDADENTETIINGYDNSDILSDNSRLSDSLDEYDSVESEIMDSVNDSLNNFDSVIDSVGNSEDHADVLSSMAFIADFLQDIYEASGVFKYYINFCFLIAICGIVIGLYRFGGG